MDNLQSTVKDTSESRFKKISKKFFSDNSDKLLTQGNNYLKSDKLDNALKCYQCAYTFLQNEKDVVGEGYALTGIGFIHKKRREFREAKKYYESSLNKFKEAKDKERSKKVSKLLGDLLLTIADEELRAKRFKDAENSYIESSKYYNDSEDILGDGYALTGLGLIYGKYKEYEKSRLYYEKALKKFQNARDFKRAGIVSKLIANSYELQESLDEALINYELALQLFKDAKNYQREIEIKKDISLLQNRKSKLKASKKQIFFLSTYLILVCSAEIVTTYYNTYAGLIIHASILATLLLHSSVEKSNKFSNLLMCMMAVPLIRIIGLTIPLMQTQALYWFPIIAIPLFAASVTIIKIQKINRIDLGLTFGNIPLQILIALSGIVIGFIEYQILQPKPLIHYFSIESVIIAGLILMISTGFAEELLFRGIIQKNAEKIIGSTFGILYTSLIFTSLHIGWNSIFDWVLVFGVSLFYGYMFYKTKSLFGVTLSHGISNSMLFLILPFIVF